MLLPILLSTFLYTAPAADSLTGNWQIKGDVMGNPVNSACTFKQADTVLTGSCTGAEGSVQPVTGAVKNGTVTFQHAAEYEGQPLIVVYTGTLASPAELKGTIDVQPMGAAGTFTATPAPAKP